MLLQFRVKNYKSFTEEAILDFSATSIAEHTYHLHKSNDIDVLPFIAIYGANAAGKTNLLSALNDMCYFIKSSLEVPDKEMQYRLLSAPSLLNDRHTVTEYEVTLSLDKDYRYGYHIDFNGIIHNEYLEYRKTSGGAFFRIFEREFEKTTKITGSDAITRDERRVIKSISSIVSANELLLTMLGSRRSQTYSESLSTYITLYDWFSGVVECPECSSKKLDLLEVLDNVYLSNMFVNNDAIDEYVGFIQKADPTIRGIKLKKENEAANSNEITQHVLINREMGKGNRRKVEFPTILESSGTLYLLRAYPVIKHALDKGRMLIADEIDRSLHPSLLLDIVNLFTNPETNPNHAQLLCTMHNVILMDKRFLRRDEIWFVEKNKRGESVLYSLADFKLNDKTVRNDADFCKNYILGMYGAVPEK